MRERVDAIIQKPTGDWLQFGDPARIVVADQPADVRPALAEVERLTRDLELHAVGILTYEAGLAFGLQTCPPSEPATIPLVWFGLFEGKDVRVRPRPVREGEYRLGALSPSLGRNAFQQAFEAIKRHLAAGDTYQANFTFKMTGEFEGDPISLFADLIDAQQGRYSAFLRAGNWAVCSASPELFFELDGVAIRSRPMKGTARRGLTAADDSQRRDELHASAKQRAENVMIVDMIRNDLGRVAQIGSVEVPELFAIEQYPNVWQMTSLVTARSLASLEDIFAAMHPSASVTGAPKVRTMEILSELEMAPRGVYTGAIGYVPPDGNARFNVAIRTAVVDLAARRVEFGIGSGIVWDSDATAEYEECLLKGSVIGRPPVRFELLETLRWTSEDGYFLLDRHLDRIRASARYFDFGFDDEVVRRELAEAAKAWRVPHRVRLVLARDAAARVESSPLTAQKSPLSLRLAREPINRDDPWLYHKTTNREVYERARQESPESDEVILWNPSGEVTEATTANVVVELAGSRVTPPVASGLLAGTFRAELLQRGEIQERVLTVEDLRTSSRIWLINSVHEWREATLHP